MLIDSESEENIGRIRNGLIHEAGHIVIGFRLDVPILGVTINATHKSNKGERKQEDIENEVIMGLAGCKVDLKRGRRVETHFNTDIKESVRLLLPYYETAIDRRKIIEKLSDVASEMINESKNWYAITYMGKQLINRFLGEDLKRLPSSLYELIEADELKRFIQDADELYDRTIRAK